MCIRDSFSAFESYYCSQLETREMALCMLEGKTEPLALQHPKGIIPMNGNAKLISANDSSGFTYRGRFSDDSQAATVGYIASQKAHNALRWLASEQRVREFSRIFLCWNPAGKTLPRPMRRMRDADAAPLRKPSDYQEQLKSTLLSFRKDHQLQDTDCAVLVSFDAATTGRLAVTYYNEITLKTFLERIHEMCIRDRNAALTIEDQRLDPPVAFGTVVPSGYNEDGDLLNGAFTVSYTHLFPACVASAKARSCASVAI